MNTRIVILAVAAAHCFLAQPSFAQDSPTSANAVRPDVRPVTSLEWLKSLAQIAEQPATQDAQQGRVRNEIDPHKPVLQAIEKDRKAAAAKAAASAATAAASPLRPFDEVIKEAKRIDGFLPIWRKDDKIWIEVPENMIGAEGVAGPQFLFSVNIANSVGERGLYASQMGPRWLSYMRRVGNAVHLMAANTQFRAPTDKQSALAVSQAFSDSLLSAAPVLSLPHKERKSVLIDANLLLIRDVVSYGTRVDAAFRSGYAMDTANSLVETAYGNKQQSTVKVNAHFAVARIPAPPAVFSPLIPVASPSRVSADPRSFYVGFVYNFRKLPDTPMASRLADQRIGHFVSSYTDLSDDMQPNPRVHFVNRWRLEKKDPAAALSEPIEPITYWVDKNVPKRYRNAVVAGIEQWNKAFEKIGFKNAVVAKIQPDDATWDNMDATHASIRWFLGADVGFAIGPSHTDPRTGEILDADIGMSDVFGRGTRRLISEETALMQGAKTGSMTELQSLISPESRLAHIQQQQTLAAALNWGHDHNLCTYSQEAASEAAFAMDVLEANGTIAPDSPQAEEFVQSVVRDVIAHEVGHTLGFRHNFRASTVYTPAQLRDAQFTRKNGTAGSVMDYNPYNLALNGETQGGYNMPDLGPYDYWAVEYAYSQMPAKDEAAALKKIMSKANDPLLAFSTDEDTGIFDGGLDPLVNTFDMSSDPLDWFKRRLIMSQQLFERMQNKQLADGQSYVFLRRNVVSGLRQLQRNAPNVAKYIGGASVVRDFAGTGRLPITPVPVAKQREALQFVTQNLFGANSFKFKPDFVRSISTIEYLDRDFGANPRLDLSGAILSIQSEVLTSLMLPNRADRLIDNTELSAANQALSVSEVYSTLRTSIWSELAAGKSLQIDRNRRNLQRYHLQWVMFMVMRGSQFWAPDAASQMRQDAVKLQSQLAAAAARAGNPETRAHVQESLRMINEALKAPLVKVG